MNFQKPNSPNGNTAPRQLGAWTLRNILENRKFLVPDYQRGYAWSNRENNHQLEEFWDDLDGMGQGTETLHYMGALVVEPAGAYLALVDGQQRLTTIALLLSVLNAEPVAWLRYGEGNLDREMLNVLLSSGPLPAGAESSFTPTPDNAYQRHLLAAKAFFSEKVRGLDESGRAALRNKCLDRLVFDFSLLGDNLDAGIVFETMNNRGKPLTLLEKLKNRLIYLAETVAMQEAPATDGTADGDAPEDEEDVFADIGTNIANVWGEIYRELGKNPAREPLDEDEFLAAHLSLYRRPKESVYSEVVAESRLFKMFTENSERHPLSERIDERNAEAMEKEKRSGNMEPVLTAKKINDYVADLYAFASVWAGIHDEFASPCGRCRLLSGTREVKVFLAAVALDVTDENLRSEIFEATEKILFRNTIRSVMDEGALAQLGRRLHGHCPGANGIDAAGVLADLIEALHEANRTIDADHLIRVFSERMDRSHSPYGFYGWAGLKYFLFSEEGDNGFPWEQFEVATLEHIIPQSAVEDRYDGWWTRQMAEFEPDAVPERWAKLDDAGKKAIRKRKRTLVNSLGNFVILSQSDNASVSDEPWEQYPAVEGGHAAVVGKQAFYQTQQANNGAKEVAGTSGSWNAFKIRERGRRLFVRLADKLGVAGLKEDRDRIDAVLGFTPDDEALQDTTFAPLPETEVSKLAPRPTGAASPSNQRLHKRIPQIRPSDGERAEALNAMSKHLGLPIDWHNTQIVLGKFPHGTLLLRFTRNNPHAVWNFWVADKQDFADRYGNELANWARGQGLDTRLGKDHKFGNGIQFRPGVPVDFANIDCPTLADTGNAIRAQLENLPCCILMTKTRTP